MMQSELSLKAAHENCLMADCHPLLQQNRHYQGDNDYTGTAALQSQSNPWSVHEENRPDSAQTLPRLW